MELSKMDKIIKLSKNEGITSLQTILEIRLLCFSISPCDLETKRETREIKRKSNQIFKFFLFLTFDPSLSFIMSESKGKNQGTYFFCVYGRR